MRYVYLVPMMQSDARSWPQSGGENRWDDVTTGAALTRSSIGCFSCLSNMVCRPRTTRSVSRWQNRPLDPSERTPLRVEWRGRCRITPRHYGMWTKQEDLDDIHSEHLRKIASSVEYIHINAACDHDG